MGIQAWNFIHIIHCLDLQNWTKIAFLPLPGQYEHALQLVEDCVTSIEAQFGRNSVEVSRELLKLDDLVTLYLDKMSRNGNQDTDKYR